MILLYFALISVRTKALEEKYFAEANDLRSRLEMAEEEKKRFLQVLINSPFFYIRHYYY